MSQDPSSAEQGAGRRRGTTPVIRTKLRTPRLPGDFVSRDRLTRLIEHGSRRAVVLVSAPAGFGKSSAVLDWSLTTGRSADVSWLSLDGQDDIPSRFWSHVLAALQARDSSVGRESSEWLSETVDGDPLLFMSTFLNELTAIGSDRWLVLDDVHHLEDRELLQQLDYVLRHLPTHLSLIMTCRTDPGLRLHRLRANGDLVDVRSDDLRMTRGEIATFISARCGELAEDMIGDLEARTAGWPVAVQLMTVRLAQSDDPSRYLAESIDDVRPVVDYMVAEILDNLPATLRTFVLEISVLDGFSEDIVNVLLDRNDSQYLINEIVHRGLFVTESTGEEHWYRFHQLFADIVRSELRYRDHGRWLELNRRAAALFAERGQLDQAMDHAHSGKDWDFVIGHAAEAFLRFANRGHIYRFRDWLSVVPADVIGRDAATASLVGVAHIMAGDFDGAEQHLEKAIAADQTANDVWPSLSARAFLALLAGNRGDVTAWHRIAEDALEPVPKTDGFSFHVAESLASAQLAAANYYLGDLDGALGVGRRLLAITGRIESPVPRAAALGAVGLATAFGGDLQVARSALEDMSSIIDGTDLEVRINGAVRDELAGRLSFEADDLDEGLFHLERAWEARWVRPVALPGIAAVLSRTHLGRGDSTKARTWLGRAENALAAVAVHHFGHLEVLMAELALVEAGIEPEQPPDLHLRFSAVGPHLSGDPALVATVGARRAQRALDRPATRLPALQSPPRGPRASLLLHLLRVVEATEDATREHELVAALDLVQSTGLIRVVREWGQGVARDVLRLAGDHPAAVSVAEPVREPSNVVADPLPEPLTASERRVLGEMTSGDSYQEIAGRLFVSQNTVKSHVKAIYRKLGAHSRVVAVERARELGLLDSVG